VTTGEFFPNEVGFSDADLAFLTPGGGSPGELGSLGPYRILGVLGRGGKGKPGIEDRFHAFVLHRNQEPVLVSIPNLPQVEASVVAWRAEAQKSRPDRDKLDRAGQTLREQLWLPIAKHLGDARTVLISPDGVLAQLPFAALPGASLAPICWRS
jgi:hypothetical protein